MAEEKKKSYIVEYDEMIDNMRVVTIFGNMGHRCGYVGVPAAHPLYGLSYTDNIPEALLKKWEDVKEGPVGKRGMIDVLCIAVGGDPHIGYIFDVHGGITYSSDRADKVPSTYPVESNLWWFGFDCGHSGDAKDIEATKEHGFDTQYMMRFYMGGEVRSKEYTISEAKSLAEQLKQISEVK